MPSDSPRRLTLDAIFRGKDLDEKSLRAPQWLKDNHRFVYLDDFPGTKRTTIWVYDVATLGRTPLLNPGKLRYRKDGKTARLAIHAITLSKDEGRLLLTTEAPARFKPCGDLFVYDMAEGALTRLTRTESPQYHPRFSPDGSRVGFIRDNEVWMVEVSSGAETRLTFDASETVYNGRCGWVYEEELGLAASWEWSPDGGTIAFLQQDETEVPEVLLSQYDKPHADPRRTRYPKAGDPNPTVRLGFLDVGSAPSAPRWSAFDACVPDEEHYLAHLQWAPHGGCLLVQCVPRLQNRLLLLAVDPVTGTARTVIEETDEAWVDHPGKLHFIGESSRFLWPSERDGWRRYYVCDLDGACHGPIGTGAWETEGIAAVDAERGCAYVVAAYPKPTERTLLRAPLDGGPCEPITATEGRHGALFSRDCSLRIETHSSLNAPPIVELRDSSGALLDTLVEDGSPNLARYGVARDVPTDAESDGWRLLTFETEDGTALQARMLLPRSFDAGRRYPALMHTYGGPGSQVVVNAWGGKGALWYHYLAERGYVIFLCDNRGTGACGRAFKKITYLKLGDYEVRDQIAGARYLGSLPFVDPKRIAIWGWSYGGYMAANLILKGADVFRAAIAVAPVTDWKLYDTIYTERYMRRPCDNPEGYREGSPVHFAHRLKGRFLLLHGTMDDNVHFQNAARLASALQDKGKQFETMFYPGRHHGIENRHLHLYRAMTDFLRRAL